MTRHNSTRDWEITEYTIRVRHGQDSSPPTQDIEELADGLLELEGITGVEAQESRTILTNMSVPHEWRQENDE